MIDSLGTLPLPWTAVLWICVIDSFDRDDFNWIQIGMKLKPATLPYLDLPPSLCLEFMPPIWFQKDCVLILIEKKLKSATHTHCLSSSDSFCAQKKNFKPVHFYKVQYLKILWLHIILFSLYFQPLNHNRNRKKA